MSLRRYIPTNRNDEADLSRSSLEFDGNPTYTSNVTTPPTHNLPGRDSVREPDETKPSLADKFRVIANPNYSKRPSGNSLYFSFC